MVSMGPACENCAVQGWAVTELTWPGGSRKSSLNTVMMASAWHAWCARQWHTNVLPERAGSCSSRPPLSRRCRANLATASARVCGPTLKGLCHGLGGCCSVPRPMYTSCWPSCPCATPRTGGRRSPLGPPHRVQCLAGWFPWHPIRVQTCLPFSHASPGATPDVHSPVLNLKQMRSPLAVVPTPGRRT